MTLQGMTAIFNQFKKKSNFNSVGFIVHLHITADLSSKNIYINSTSALNIGLPFAV